LRGARSEKQVMRTARAGSGPRFAWWVPGNFIEGLCALPNEQQNKPHQHRWSFLGSGVSSQVLHAPCSYSAVGVRARHRRFTRTRPDQAAWWRARLTTMLRVAHNIALEVKRVKHARMLACKCVWLISWRVGKPVRIASQKCRRCSNTPSNSNP
jgi:hypothetical protein